LRGRNFFPHKEGTKPESRVGFLGRGQQAPPHQLGELGERCKLPQRGPENLKFGAT